MSETQEPLRQMLAAEQVQLAEKARMLRAEVLFCVITVAAYGSIAFLLVADFAVLATGPRLPIFVFLLLILIGGTAYALHRVRGTWMDWRRLQHPSGHTPQG